MTIEESIKQLQLNKPSAYSELRNAIDIAIEALEKQIPKGVEIIDYGFGKREYHCPSCGLLVYNSYCDECGQKLDWT